MTSPVATNVTLRHHHHRRHRGREACEGEGMWGWLCRSLDRRRKKKEDKVDLTIKFYLPYDYQVWAAGPRWASLGLAGPRWASLGLAGPRWAWALGCTPAAAKRCGFAEMAFISVSAAMPRPMVLLINS
jgi:hypothetical protein